jgi:phosphoribosylaminoimidazole (AIR) synthetase
MGDNMRENIDDYIQKVIGIGDEGSRLLAKLTAHTLKNSELVDVITSGMGGLAVLRIPDDHVGYVHSAGGDPKITATGEYTASMIEKLVEQAKVLGTTPVAISNVVDARNAPRSMVERIGRALRTAADKHDIAIMNGELAILGRRVGKKPGFNICGTMISIGKRTEQDYVRSPEFKFKTFEPSGKPVVINSDGIGTKTEFYERAMKEWLGVEDFIAMNLDDCIKIGATAIAISAVLETKGDVPVEMIRRYLTEKAYELGVAGILEHEIMNDRINGYVESGNGYNMSGSVVSVIDEARLANPPKPVEGDYILAIRKENPNPRSNGITDKRKAMVKLFGDHYHKTDEGMLFLKYLAEPSAILYGVFRKLLDSDAASSFYHMSGGAFNGKLARPLAKEGLFARLSGLFEPDWRELTLAGANFTSAETAYQKWPMGNDGFVTTIQPCNAMKIIESLGYESKVVGRIEKRQDRTGVELTAYNGEIISYKGR